MQIALSYVCIIVAVLALLNTYPLIASENMVFKSKQTTMQSSVSVMVSSLSGLDVLTQKNVAQAMTVAEETTVSRVLVTNAAGRILFDSRETGNARGDYAVYTEIVQALAGNDAFHSRYEDGAFRSRAASPVIYQGEIIGAVYAYEFDPEQGLLLLGLQQNLKRISFIIALAVLVLSAVIYKMISARFGQLIDAIRIVREGNYDHRTGVEGNDEIAALAKEFDSLTDRLEITENIRRRFVADASHELKTPLASIRLLSDSILQTEEIDDATMREFVGDIHSESERLQRITEELLRLTKLDSAVEKPVGRVEVSDVVERVVHMLRMQAQEHEISLRIRTVTTCAVRCTEDDLYQILYNLVENAIKYNHAGGFVELGISEKEKQVYMTVEDNGIGIPVEEMSRIFERFYRVDKARSRAAGGTGLGLSIVRDTAVRYGGDVTVEPRAEGGTIFTVMLPEWQEGGAE